MMKVVEKPDGGFCSACFDGNYPIGVGEQGPQPIQLNLFGGE